MNTFNLFSNVTLVKRRLVSVRESITPDQAEKLCLWSQVITPFLLMIPDFSSFTSMRLMGSRHLAHTTSALTEITLVIL